MINTPKRILLNIPAGIVLVIFISMTITVQLLAQTKTEHEFRIKPEEVPAKAISFIEQCQFPKKIKWYAEESQNGKSFEAKTKFRKTTYSCEFDSTGNIEDIEWIIDFPELDKNLQFKMDSSLNQLYLKYRVIKLQVQWFGEPESLIKLIHNSQSDEPYTTRYEMVIRNQKENSSDYSEILFDDQGRIIDVYRIVQPSTDNLEF
jgi:hypothetical protein